MYFQRRADGELLDTNVTSPNRLYTRYEVAPRPSLCLMSSAPKPILPVTWLSTPAWCREFTDIRQEWNAPSVGEFAPKPRGASSTGLAQLPSRLKLISSLKPTPIAHGQPFYTAIPTAQSMTSPADWLLGWIIKAKVRLAYTYWWLDVCHKLLLMVAKWL